MIARASLSLLAALLLVPQLAAAQDFDKVELKRTQLADGIYVLEGAGGNLGLCTGKDGAFLIARRHVSTLRDCSVPSNARKSDR